LVKIVINANAEDLVPCIPPEPHPLKLEPSVTYVLVGGLGGLGRSMAKWMLTKGARNFAFISRSGASGVEAAETLENLSREGANAIAYSCDICEPEQLRKTVDLITSEMPPVRGLIQGAMVLKGCLLIRN
jgi:NAD(P)-dependent dehydrogenase (short-subunit alcohol dehydrogenase family)